MLRTGLIALVAGLMESAGPATAQSVPDITYEWAARSSAYEAGHRLLGVLANLYPNMSKPFSSPFSDGALTDLIFASDVRSTGMPGICAADFIQLSFSLADRRETDYSGSHATAPVTISSAFSGTNYVAHGDTAPGSWSQTGDNILRVSCGNAGDRSKFFHAEDSINAWLALRLPTLLVEFAIDGGEDLARKMEGCIGERCAAPRSLLAELGGSQLMTTDTRPCDPMSESLLSESRQDVCLTATYLLSRRGNETDELAVNARLRRRYDPESDDELEPSLLGFSMSQYKVIED